MGRIQSNIGLITGTDIAGTVDKLISLSAIPRNRLQSQVESLRNQQVSVGELTALVIGVQLQSTRIGASANLSSVNLSSSDDKIIKATSTGSPTPGTYSIRTIATAQNSSQISTSFGSTAEKLTAGKVEVITGGFLDASAQLDTLRGGAGVERGKLLITNRNGDSRTVDIRTASTLQDVAKAINETDGLKVTASVKGDRLELTDLTGSTSSNLIVSEVNGGRTAADLGFVNTSVAASTVEGDKLAFLGSASLLSNLRDGRGIDLAKGVDFTLDLSDGSTLTVDISDSSPPKNVGEFLTAINAAANGKFLARIASDGVSIEFEDKSTGSGTFAISGKTAEAFGLTDKTAVGGVISGTRVQSAASGTLLGTLKGGKGIGTPGVLAVTNRSGASTNIDLTGSESLKDVIDKINASSAGITASLNKSRTGITIKDISGATTGNLIIADGDANNSATKLGIVSDAAVSEIDSGSLSSQFISRSTKLATLNSNTGVKNGSFTITNSAGQIGAINLSVVKPETVGDVIDAINNLNINVTATLNDTGDGFDLIDNSTGSGTLSVVDTASGTAAKELGLTGTAVSKTFDLVTKKVIGSRQNLVIDVAADDTVDSVVKKLQATGSPVNASLLNVGDGRVRVLLNAKTSGLAGRVYVEGDAVGFGTTQTAQARDAVIALNASEESGGTLIRSATNDFVDVLPGLSLNVQGVSKDAITIKAEKSFSKIETNLKLFVDQYNKVIDKLKAETKFDSVTNTTGNLFGTSEALRVEQGLQRFITARTFGVGSIQSVAQLGIDVGEDGKLSLDSTKLNAIVAKDPASVENYLSNEKSGFAARSKTVFDNLVGVDGGVLVTRNTALQSKVETTNERINNYNIKLDRERTRLTKQFTDLETAISRIQANYSSLNLSVFDYNNNN